MPLTEVFLCSLPPHACCTLFPLVSSCITHLCTHHPEHTLLLRRDGLVGLQKLPTAITLSSPPDPLAALVWVCDECRRLFNTRAAASAHWLQAPEHSAWAARTLREEGERGCTKWIDGTARGMLMKARIEVLNHYFGQEHNPPAPVAARVPPAMAVPQPAPVAAVVPAAAALPPPQFRVQVGPPYAARSLLISLTAETIAELAAQLGLAWGAVENQPPWTELLEEGLSITFDHRDGTAGSFVVKSDRGVKKLKEVMKYGVARVGRA